MHSAILIHSKKLITAKSYDEELHGKCLECMDKSCGAPVIYIPERQGVAAHFKTSGKGESIHKATCGFGKNLDFATALSKVNEYQEDYGKHGIREILVRLNLNTIDPDYEPRVINRESNEEKEVAELDEKVLKSTAPTPKSIGSLKTVKKLFTTVEPDLLASIIISGKGSKVPVSELIRSSKDAHKALWENMTLDFPYFIHGTIEKVIRREKVWFIKLDAIEDTYFSLVVFEKYFHHFTYKDAELVGRSILAYGYLKKNEFNKEKPATEMIIKSNKYIEFL